MRYIISYTVNYTNGMKLYANHFADTKGDNKKVLRAEVKKLIKNQYLKDKGLLKVIAIRKEESIQPNSVFDEEDYINLITRLKRNEKKLDSDTSE